MPEFKPVVVDKETLLLPVLRFHDGLKRRSRGLGDVAKQERLGTPQMNEARETSEMCNTSEVHVTRGCLPRAR
jgi:hypothetical protein